jgi:hypothetical protein
MKGGAKKGTSAVEQLEQQLVEDPELLDRLAEERRAEEQRDSDEDYEQLSVGQALRGIAVEAKNALASPVRIARKGVSGPFNAHVRLKAKYREKLGKELDFLTALDRYPDDGELAYCFAKFLTNVRKHYDKVRTACRMHRDAPRDMQQCASPQAAHWFQVAIDLEPERGDILADYAFLLQQVGSGLHYPDCYRLAATRLWLHGASQCRAFGPAAMRPMRCAAHPCYTSVHGAACHDIM